MVDSLTPHQPCGNLTQLLIYQADELISGQLVAVARPAKHECQIAPGLGLHITSAREFHEGFYRHYPQDLLRGQAAKAGAEARLGAMQAARRALEPSKIAQTAYFIARLQKEADNV
jgi:hypothetical protein